MLLQVGIVAYYLLSHTIEIQTNILFPGSLMAPGPIIRKVIKYLQIVSRRKDVSLIVGLNLSRTS